MLGSPDPTTVSMESYLEYWRQRLPWSEGLEASFRAEFEVGPAGDESYRVPSHAGDSLLNSLTSYPRSNADIQAPSLAIYGPNARDELQAKGARPLHLQRA